MKNWMKNIICSREWSGEVSKMDRVWSRMTSIKPAYNQVMILTFLFLVLGGFTMSAWAGTVPEYHDGTWYSLYDCGKDYENETKTFDVVAPNCGTLYFDWKKTGGTWPAWGAVKVDMSYMVTDEAGFVGKKRVAEEGVGTKPREDYKTESPAIDSLIKKVKFEHATGSTYWRQLRNFKLSLANHIRLDDGTTYGTTSVTGIDLGSALPGNQSATSYDITLRSFLMAGTKIRYTTSNSEFHFGSGATTKEYSVMANSCAYTGGEAKCDTTNTVLGNPEFYGVNVYFTPATNKNGSSSATITIYDVPEEGEPTARATITLTAKVIPTYYFKATSVATDGTSTLDIPVRASFTSGVYSTSYVAGSWTAATADVASKDTVAYFYAPASQGDYQFQGWYRKSDCSDTRVSTDNTISCTVTATSLNSATPTDSVFYAKYLESITAEFDNTGSHALYVGDTYEDIDYSRTSSDYATDDDESEENYFWYEIVDNEPEGNTTGSDHPLEIISYDPTTKVVTAHNAGTATLILHQREHGLYEAVDAEYEFTVSKKDNNIVCSWGEWSKNVNFDTKTLVAFTSDNDAYSRITVTPFSGRDVATHKEGVDSDPDTLVANYHDGSAIWQIEQAEDYMYEAAEMQKCTLTVNTIPTTDCLTLHSSTPDNTASAVGTISWDLDSVASQLQFDMKMNFAGYRLIVSRYVDGSWEGNDTTISGAATKYEDGHKTVYLPAKTTKIKFGKYNDDNPYVNNVVVTRRKYFDIKNAAGSEITTLAIPKRMVSGSATNATFYVHFSTCASKVKLASTNPHITFANGKTTDEFDVGNVNSQAITLSYTSATLETISDAKIYIYTPYEQQILTVTTQTVDLFTPTITWPGTKEFAVGDDITNGFYVVDENGDPITGDLSWTFTSLDEEVVDVISEGKALKAHTLSVDSKSTTVTGILAAGDTYKSGSCDVVLTVKRKDNTITIGGGFSETMLLDATMSSIAVSSSNSDTENKPFSISRRPSADTAVFTMTGAGAGSIESKHYLGTVTWRVHQDADGMYKAADKDFSVTISKDSESSDKIYIFESPTNVEYDRGEFGQQWWDAKSVAKKLYVQVRLTDSGGKVTAQEYIDLPKKGWTDISGDIKNGAGANVSTYDAGITAEKDLNIATTGIKFNSGGGGNKYVRNVKVECYSHLRVNVNSDETADTIKVTKQAGGVKSIYVEAEGKDSMTVYYGLASGGDLKLVCDNPKFTFTDIHANDLTLVDGDALPKAGKSKIYVYYTSSTVGNDTAHVILYNKVYYKDVVVVGYTVELDVEEEDVEVDKDADWTEEITEATPVVVKTGADITIDSEVSVYSLNIESGSTVTITPTGGLTIGAGGLTIGGEAKSAGKLVLQAVTPDSEGEDPIGQTSYVLFSPEYDGDMPEMTVELYSVGYKDVLGRSEGEDYWQYVGVPVSVKDYAAKTVFNKSMVQSWIESEGRWVNNRDTLNLRPFEGFATSQYRNTSGYKTTFSGQLAENRGVVEIPLSYTEGDRTLKGWNLVANSFAGPIDITRLTEDDFGEAVATIYIWDARDERYKPAPVGSLGLLSEDYPHVIPSMQAFFIKTESATTLTLDYNRIVWRGTQENKPLRSPKFIDESEVSGRMRISLIDEDGQDQLYMLESESYSKDYENGYDAPKKHSKTKSSIYAIDDERELAVDATDEMIGTEIGIKTGESDWYTMSFDNVEGEKKLCLRDSWTGKETAIENGATYSFYAEPNSVVDGRFAIIAAKETSNTATGVGNEEVEKKATKYIKDDTVYILKNGIKYNSLGQRVQ